MNSFNVYGQTEQVVGGNTHVWLGAVKPVPRGVAFNAAPGLYPAGSAVIYNSESDSVTIITGTTGSGSSMLAEANAYLYNDVRATEPGTGVPNATCALVMHHPEGLLIERVYPEITEEQIATLQAQIPGVLLVRG